MLRPALRVAAAFVIVAAPAALAQDTTVTSGQPEARWLAGGALGIPGAGGDAEPGIVTVGLQVTRYRPMRPGLDFAFGIAPRLVQLGGVGARAGITVPLTTSERMAVLPMAGVSGIAALFEDGGAVGPAAGASLLLGSPGRAMTRIAVTWHWFAGDEPLWLLEVGFATLRGSNANHDRSSP